MCMYVFVCVYMSMCVYVFVCVYMSMCVYVFVCICRCVYLYKCTRLCTILCTYVSVYTHIGQVRSECLSAHSEQAVVVHACHRRRYHLHQFLCPGQKGGESKGGLPGPPKNKELWSYVVKFQFSRLKSSSDTHIQTLKYI